MMQPALQLVPTVPYKWQTDGDVVGEVSHEIGNPLFVIAGFSELLLADPEGYGLNKSAAQRIQLIHQMAIRASAALHKIQAEAAPAPAKAS